MQRRGKIVWFFIAASVLATWSLVPGPWSLAQTRGQGSGVRNQRTKLHASSSLVSTEQLLVMADDEMESSSKGQTDVFVPVPGSGSQEDQVSWSSRLWIHNLDASPANVQFFLFKLNQSNPMPAVYNDTIAAGGTRHYDRALETLFDETGGAVLRVVSDQKLIVRTQLETEKAKGNDVRGPWFVVRGNKQQTTDNGQRTTDQEGQGIEAESLVRQFFAAVPASFAMSAGQKTTLLGAYPSSLLTGRALDLPAGVMEVTGDTAIVRVTALDEAGNMLASKDYTLAAYEPRQYALSEFLSGSSASPINLEVEVVSGSGKIIAFGADVSRREATGDRLTASEATTAKPGDQSTISDGSSNAEKTQPPGPITGSGTAGQIALWTEGQTLGNSTLAQDSTGKLGIGGFGEKTRLVVNESELDTAIGGRNDHGIGLHGLSQNGTAVVGFSSADGTGVQGHSESATGVMGESDSGPGVMGQSNSGRGVYGTSKALSGVVGESEMLHGVGGLSKGGGYGVLGRAEGSALAGVHGRGTGTADGVQGVAEGGGIGVKGESMSAAGVQGQSTSGQGGLFMSSGGRGVEGRSQSAEGVYGQSSGGPGVKGQSNSNVGVQGVSASGRGVEGRSQSLGGVVGISTSGVGVAGESTSESGVLGTSQSGSGVEGQSTSSAGVLGRSDSGRGIHGMSQTTSGVLGESEMLHGVAGVSRGGGFGVLGRAEVAALAGVRGQGTGEADGVQGVAEGGGSGVKGESMSGIGVRGVSASNSGVKGESTSSVGVEGRSSSDSGVEGTSTSGVGVAGISSSNSGMEGQSRSGIGVKGGSTSGNGVEGTSPSNNGVRGVSQSSTGVRGESTSGRGVQGFSTSQVGVRGESQSSIGVGGVSTSFNGVVGLSRGTGDSAAGVLGTCDNCIGVAGNSTSEEGVFGVSTSQTGVRGEGFFGVAGIGTGGGSGRTYGVVGGCGQGVARCGAALFSGTVEVAGAKLFHIDHPLDPANKYLNHVSVESPEMKNIYDGVIVLGNHGEAVVTLPDWFGALNTDFRYQLTAIGAPGPSLYVAEEIKNNRFKIAGGTPGMKVSWQVTGIRHDAWANAHPLAVEEDKPDAERGHYLHPTLFGQSVEKSLLRLFHSDLLKPQRKDRDAVIKELKEEPLK